MHLPRPQLTFHHPWWNQYMRVFVRACITVCCVESNLRVVVCVPQCQSCLASPLSWWGCPVPVGVSRSSPACCGCSRSICHSGLCESPSRHWWGAERRTAVEGWRIERSSAPAGLCRQESRVYPALNLKSALEERDNRCYKWLFDIGQIIKVKLKSKKVHN